MQEVVPQTEDPSAEEEEFTAITYILSRCVVYMHSLATLGRMYNYCSDLLFQDEELQTISILITNHCNYGVYYTCMSITVLHVSNAGGGVKGEMSADHTCTCMLALGVSMYIIYVYTCPTMLYLDYHSMDNEKALKCKPSARVCMHAQCTC